MAAAVLGKDERWVRFTQNGQAIDAAGQYSVTRDGRIFSYKEAQRRKLKQRPNRGGYNRVALFVTGRRWNARAHRIVIETWGSPHEGELEVNHIDGDKLNNHIDNLEWATKSENQKHAHRIGLVKQRGKHNHGAKVSERGVRMIRWLASTGTAQSEIEKVFGLGPKGAYPIVSGKSWKHVTEDASAEEINEACLRMSGHRVAQTKIPTFEAGNEDSAKAMLAALYGLRTKAFARRIRKYAEAHDEDLHEAIGDISRFPSPKLWRLVPVTDHDYMFSRSRAHHVRQYEVWEFCQGYAHANILQKWVNLWWRLDATSSAHLDIRLFDVDVGSEVIFDPVALAYRPNGIEGDLTRFSSLRRLVEDTMRGS